ncbi:MAG TPA: DUF5996 family protein [Candidatus Dormibacteraeota bacterium]|nr:DUF5996 family protein [Candidatus Dormibacteraeota bacterium]
MNRRGEAIDLTHENAWPALPLAEWQLTRDTLHMWTQIVGKVRLALAPHVNHWWQVPLYVTSRGLSTSPVPCGRGTFEVEFDFIAHVLRIVTSWDQARMMSLTSQTVADFYRNFMSLLDSLGISVKIWPMPVEVANPIRFDQDTVHQSYDPMYAHSFWRILVSADTVFKEFRGRFIGKASPVHFFWGSFDLAVTRFSGRRAPARPGADRIMREAYSHEVISAGWWPGGGDVTQPMFYAYAAPEPAGFREAPVRPERAAYNAQVGEFLLPYDEVRTADEPRIMLLDFMQSTYEAGATLGNWDRAALERSI